MYISNYIIKGVISKTKEALLGIFGGAPVFPYAFSGGIVKTRLPP